MSNTIDNIATQKSLAHEVIPNPPLLKDVIPTDESNKGKEVVNLIEVDPDNEDGDGIGDAFGGKKRKRTSKASNEFKEIILKDGSAKAECVHCKHQFAMVKGGPTTQYLRHLKTCMRRKANKKGQQELAVKTIINEAGSIASVQNFKYDPRKIREVSAHMVMVHELPFLFAEYELFHLLMKTATPHFEPVSRATIRKDCFSSYEIEKKKVLSQLKEVNKVSLTTDMWKSDNQHISYMVVTCHFVDSNWNLQKRTLSFCDVPPPHTGSCISDALQRCLADWKLEEKVWTVTVDNASSNDAAIRELKENLSYKTKLALDGKLFHVRCCSHILNLLVQDGLSEIGYVIQDVRESVKYITNSESRFRIFGEIVKNLRLSSKHLILDCSTRWNATYFMLSAALEVKDVFLRYQQKDPSYHTLPSEEDWKKVAEVCSFLQEFNEITNSISGYEYPTSNLFLFELHHIKILLDKKSVDDSCFMQSMVMKMKAKFDKYWSECNLVISMAAVMDPRNKMVIINWSFPMIYSETDSKKHIETVKENLKMLYNEYVEVYKRENAPAFTINRDSVGSISRVNGKRATFKSYIHETESVMEEMKSELDMYLEDKVLDIEDEAFNALTWWKENHLKFKILSKMAVDLLSIPITSVASESAFSAGGRVIDPYRSSLGTDMVQVLLCGADWLRASYGIKKKKKSFGKSFKCHSKMFKDETCLDYICCFAISFQC